MSMDPPSRSPSRMTYNGHTKTDRDLMLELKLFEKLHPRDH
ncbi:MAG: hypothetical protein AB7P03_18560 [Kofleriaceae bacterium]